jgi:hypothetical protein
MKRFLIYIVALIVATEVVASPDSLSVATHYDALAHWELGNKAYVDGDYKRAAEEYSAIIEGGEYSMSLYYNLANAYFKMNEIGKSILYYHRALRIAPGNEDIRHNLALAEAQTKDRIVAIPEFFLNRWLRTVRNTMSCMAWSIISLVVFAVLLLFVLMFLLSSHIGVRKTGFYGALVALLLFVTTTLFALSERREMLTHDEAIVMGSAISVKSSPDRSATDLFVLHEGTKVKVLSEVDQWREITIADGKKGWTLKSNIEEI